MATQNQWIAAMVLALSCSAAMRGQDPEDVIKTDTNLVTINVSVDRDKGRPLAGLTRENFLVSEGGKQMRVEFFDNQGPASIVFVIDLSSSMQGKKWKNLKAGMKQFLANAGPGNDYTLVGFGDRPSIIARSVNEDQLWQILKTLTPSGSTALYDAMLVGLTVLAEIPQRHKALVLFSDGEDNFSRAVLIKVAKEVQAHRATIYAVGILNEYDSVPDERTGKQLLTELASTTGGLSYFPSAIDINRVLKEIRTDLTGQYTLSYYPLESQPGRRRVEVSVTQVNHRTKLRYQQYYTIR